VSSTFPRRQVQSIELVRARRQALAESQTSASENLDLFPLEICRIEPKEDGVDAECFGRGVDGYTYAIKTQRNRPSLPICEWLCYKLTDASGLPTAAPRVLTSKHFGFAFGSRWVGGLATQTASFNTPDQLLQRLAQPERLYGLYALDLFVGNGDRHLDNVLFPQVRDETNLQVIDFSRALLYHGVPPFPSPSALVADSNTASFIKQVKKFHRVSHESIERVLNVMSRVSADHVRRWAQQTPSEWTDFPEWERFVAWWESNKKNERIETIRKGIWDGSLI
jgi:hypothetical protein